MKNITEFLVKKHTENINPEKIYSIKIKDFEQLYNILTDTLKTHLSKKSKLQKDVYKVFNNIYTYSKDGIYVYDYFELHFDETRKIRVGRYKDTAIFQHLYRINGKTTYYPATVDKFAYKFNTKFWDWLNSLPEKNQGFMKVKKLLTTLD